MMYGTNWMKTGETLVFPSIVTLLGYQNITVCCIYVYNSSKKIDKNTMKQNQLVFLIDTPLMYLT